MIKCKVNKSKKKVSFCTKKTKKHKSASKRLSLFLPLHFCAYKKFYTKCT